MPDIDNKQVVRQFLEEVLNRKDFAAAAEYFGDDARDHFTGSLTTYLTFAAFPDFQLSAEHVIADGDSVTVLATFVGTHEGAVMGLEPTGRGVTGRVALSFRLAAGRIVETWAEIEPWTLMQQLGMTPHAAAAA